MDHHAQRRPPPRTDPATERCLRRLTPGDVLVGSRWIDEADVDFLHGDEMAIAERMVAKRRREFASGRVLLRQLLGADATILVGPDRRPLLPAGVCASLAHDDELAVAVLTNDPAIRGLGVDTEPTSPLPPELAEVILRGDERGLDARLAFVLKEAAYKAWSSLGGRLLGHLDVRVQTDGGHFIAAVVDDDVVLEGRFEAVRGRWLAVAAVPSDASVVGAT